MIGITPRLWPYVLAGVGSNLFGTAVVLRWLFITKETSLYADAGRELLGENECGPRKALRRPDRWF